MCSKAFSWHVIILKLRKALEHESFMEAVCVIPVLAIFSDIRVDVGRIDFSVTSFGHKFDRSAALLGGQVNAEGQFERGEQIHARFLEKST